MKIRSVNAPRIKQNEQAEPGPEQQRHADHVDACARIHGVAHNRVGTGADDALLTLILTPRRRLNSR